MITSIITSVIAYISTNIDDILILMILLSQVHGVAKSRLIAGHFLGVGFVTIISILGAWGLQNLPVKLTGILGIVPIILGIRAWFDRDGNEGAGAIAPGVLGMAMITLGNGADNIGIYLPLFTTFKRGARITAIVIFMLMTALWILLAQSIATLPKFKAITQKYKHILIPVVFIALGVLIILESGLLGKPQILT